MLNKLKTLLKEFKDFAMKGNVIDMAVGVIIGAAFGKVVTAVIDIFLNPIIEKITAAAALEGNQPGFAGSIMSFLGVLIEFVLTALVFFAIIKAVNAAKNLAKKPEEPKEPTTRDCPFCCSTISIKATRCPNCTSALPEYKP